MTVHKPSFRDILRRHRPNPAPYEKIREQLHSRPELSTLEEHTASIIANHLDSLNAFTINVGVGGHGVVAVLKNGPGETVLLRADIDALPIREQTSFPFASTVTQIDPADGVRKPVMHACGHDIHAASLLGAAEFFASTRCTGIWTGTLILLFQPAEERGTGAQAMLDDGLYTRLDIPEPDVLLAQHVGRSRAGHVGIKSGAIFTASDSFKITLFGKGGHGAAPDTAIDPIVLAAHVILRLQEIVSRELKPGVEFAVVTIGSLHAGDVENVIPEHAELKVNVRTVDQDVREKVLKSMRRIVKAECDASGSTREPEFQQISRFPPTANNAELVGKLCESFGEALDDFDPNCARDNASEDFSLLAADIGKPYAYWLIGGIDPGLWDDSNGKDIAGNHSSFFAPVSQPTISTCIDALCIGALTFMASNEDVGDHKD